MKPANTGRWLPTLYQWHWISSALSLVGMILFAVTGITLNHAADIEARPSVTQRQHQLPAPLLSELQDPALQSQAPLPKALGAWLAAEMDPALAQHGQTEWSADELYLALPRPGGDAWLRIDRHSGDIEYEDSDRGWVALLNDLHKGRHAGQAWRAFIDIFAVACLVFCVTGLLILQHHAARRPGTWPWVGLGLAAPWLLFLLMVH